MSRQKHRWMSDSVRRLDDDEWCRLDWLGKWAQKHRERKPGSSMLIDPQARDVLPLAVAYLQLMEQSCLDITLRRLRHVTKQAQLWKDRALRAGWEETSAGQVLDSREGER